MEDKRCPAFVDGKEDGGELTDVDREGKKIARYDLRSMNGASLIAAMFFSRRNRYPNRPDMAVKKLWKKTNVPCS